MAVSKSASLVEESLLDGLRELVDGYKLNGDVSESDTNDMISSKEILIAEKHAEIKKLNDQKLKQYDLLEQGIYSTEIFLERSKATAAALEACSAAIERLQEELERDRLLLEQRSSFIPRCEDLLAHYWDLDIPTRNRILRELIDKVLYTKDTKNAFLEGDKITFLLDIFPKIQENI